MKKLYKIFEIVGCIGLVLGALFIAINVLTRNVFGFVINGSYELTGLACVIFSSMAIAISTMLDGHIRIDAITSKLPIKSKIVSEYLNHIMTAVLGVVLCWAGTQYAWKMFSRHEVSTTIGAPLWPFRLIWIISAAFITIISVYRITKVKETVLAEEKEKQAVAEEGSQKKGGQ